MPARNASSKAFSATAHCCSVQEFTFRRLVRASSYFSSDWRSPGTSGRLPAPPHDETGHTWHHSDRQLLAIITDGTAAVVGGGYESDMPGFREALTSAEIEAVLDYIKSTWPQREADYQRRISNG